MKSNTINDIFEIDIPRVISPEGMGTLSFLEKSILPFPVKRVYYLYDVPSNAVRGGHAHKELVQVLIAVSGSFVLKLDDGVNSKKITLNRPNKGIVIPNGIWREMEDFSSGSVCLVLASDEFDENDYFRDYSTFLKRKK